MITKIKIYSRFHMNIFAFEEGFQFPFKDKEWALVSIWSPGDEEYLTDEKRDTLKKFGCVDGISLCFSDTTSENVEYLKKTRPGYDFTNMILFSDEQAKQTVEFIDKWNDDPEDIILIAHCDAGISRSGAVGTYACDRCRLGYSDFIRENRQVMPNHMVLRMLGDKAGMNGSAFEDLENGG